jgi:hypothetical protein
MLTMDRQPLPTPIRSATIDRRFLLVYGLASAAPRQMAFATVLGVFLAALVFAALATLAVGCGVSAPQATAERAGLAYHDATAAEYLGYVEADPTLTDAQKDRRRLAVETFATWAAQIRGRSTTGRQPLSKAGRARRAAAKAAANDDESAEPTTADPEPAQKRKRSNNVLSLATAEIDRQFGGLRADLTDPKRVEAFEQALSDLAVLATEASYPDYAYESIGREVAKPLSTIASLTAINSEDARQRFNAAAFAVLHTVMQAAVSAVTRT